jgi:hypothetical protein
MDKKKGKKQSIRTHTKGGGKQKVDTEKVEMGGVLTGGVCLLRVPPVASRPAPCAAQLRWPLRLLAFASGAQLYMYVCITFIHYIYTYIYT